MLNIGLTGGIGAGKSTVSRTLASLGAVIVDGDLIAREVVEPGTPGLAALVERFGSDILGEDGALNRPALAAIAFADDDSRAALNAIVHPLVGARRNELIEEAADDAVIVQDIPLLVETGAAAMFALVMVVYVDEEERVRRLVGQRGVPEKDARARIAAQASDEQRREVADVWLDNSGRPEELEAVVRTLWTERLEPLAKNYQTHTVARVPPALVDPKPEWPSQARRILARLAVASGDKARRIDHVGSTAIEGMPAKDVIDVQITVADMDAADALRESLETAGFPRLEHITADDPRPPYGVPGEADPSVWQKRIHGSADPGRAANVHLRVDGWPGQRFALLFRDWLSADADVAAQYLAVKRAAAQAAQGIDDYAEAIEAYVSAKEPWFDLSYGRAWEWAQRTGWTP